MATADDWGAAVGPGMLIRMILLVLLVGVIVRHWIRQLLARNDRTLPPEVVSVFPWIGSMVTYGMEPYRFFWANRRKYGDVFTFIMGGKNMTVMLGRFGSEHVFNGRLADVSAEAAYANLTVPVFGKGVVYDVPNAQLMEQKKFIKVGLTVEKFRRYVPLIAQEQRDFLLYDCHFDIAHRSSGKTIVGKALPQLIVLTAARTLQGPEARAHMDSGRMAQMLHDLDRGFTGLNFLFPSLPLPSYWKRDKAQRDLANVYKEIIRNRRETGRQEDDMISTLMSQYYKDGRDLSDDEIAHMLIALLMAGQHTSSSTTQWALLHLAAEPNFIDELYEEQKRVCGEDLPPLTYDHLQKMVLNTYVIRETLRLHPPLHSVMRKVMQDMHIPGTNYVIPEGYYVLAAPGVSAKDEANFPEPEKFLPKRWATSPMANEDNDEKVDFGYGLVSKGAKSPYLPFGAGRHRCIGEQFAYVQIGVLIATFVRTLKWRLPNGETTVPPVDYTSMVALPVSNAEIEWTVRE